MITPAARKIEATIIQMEAGDNKNCHDIRHASGEIGCRGYLTSTWKLYAELVIGYIPERTPTNEQYVTLKIIQQWLDNGRTARDIFLTWNQGNHGRCKNGTNGQGVSYDSCAYVQQALALLGK